MHDRMQEVRLLRQERVEGCNDEELGDNPPSLSVSCSDACSDDEAEEDIIATLQNTTIITSKINAKET